MKRAILFTMVRASEIGAWRLGMSAAMRFCRERIHRHGAIHHEQSHGTASRDCRSVGAQRAMRCESRDGFSIRPTRDDTASSQMVQAELAHVPRRTGIESGSLGGAAPGEPSSQSHLDLDSRPTARAPNKTCVTRWRRPLPGVCSPPANTDPFLFFQNQQTTKSPLEGDAT